MMSVDSMMLCPSGFSSGQVRMTISFAKFIILNFNAVFNHGGLVFLDLMFYLIGPLELAMVMIMVTLELGILPALAGVATTLLLIPIQAALVRPVGNIRKNNAEKTDERVRLASEVIQGSLAMKMLR